MKQANEPILRPLVAPVNRKLNKQATFLRDGRTETGSENFACQDNGLFQIFKLNVSTSKEILNNINVVM